MSSRPIASGIPASKGTVTGPVRILTKMSDIEKVENGDIIVIQNSNPAWSIALLRAAGIIVENGGIICHTAIVAREMGVPCVVGVSNATQLFTNGEKLTVDGETGNINENE